VDRRNLALVVASCLGTLLVLEAALRLIVAPSTKSYGTLFGGKLPPVRILTPATDELPGTQELTAAGQHLAPDDLWGVHREDPTLGYAPKEATISTNGWWQSNALGARDRREIAPETAAGKIRVLVFGDSFAHGSRLRQEETWPFLLDLEQGNLQVVNFGVDGYNMAQSVLRYRQLKDRLEHHVVLLMFVPSASLWRDINIIRDLGEEDWDSDLLVPRFILAGDGLTLIEARGRARPAAKGADVDPETRRHLAAHDRFYFRAKYESPPVLGRFVVYKVAARAYYEYAVSRLIDSLMDPSGEAMQVSLRLFNSMHAEARRARRSFVLVVLPIEADLILLGGSSFRKKWERMVAAICGASAALT
jgi:hypothetical protein